MVEIVSGQDLGLYNNNTGARANNDSTLGKQGDQVYVNSVTGNLVIQNQDEYIAALGVDTGLVRTYNSLGKYNDDNQDNWRLSANRKLVVQGAAGDPNTTIIKTFSDGSEALYKYDAISGLYLSNAGDGPHDSLEYDSATQMWTWNNGNQQVFEEYESYTDPTQQSADSYRLKNVRTADNQITTYSYLATDPNVVSQIDDSSGQSTILEYVGINLAKVTTVTTNNQNVTVTQSRVSYRYDTNDRLSKVIIDLTPDDLTDNTSLDTTVNGQTYVTSYTYKTATDLVETITQGDGTSISFQYYADGRIKSYTDAKSQVTTFAYDLAAESTPVVLNADTTQLQTSTTQTTTVDYNLDKTLLTTVTTGGDTVPVPGGWVNDHNVPLGNPDAISDDTPVIGTDAQGNAVVIWIEDNGNLKSVYTNNYTVGTGWSATPQSLQVTTNEASDPQLSVSDNGEAAAIWLEGNEIYLSQYTPGVGWSASELIYTSNVLSIKPQVKLNNVGDMAVTWVDVVNGELLSMTQVKPAGGSWAQIEEIILTTDYADSNSIGGNGEIFDDEGAVLSLDDIGNATVVWTNLFAGEVTFYANRYDAATGSWDGAQTISDPGIKEGGASIATDAMGNAIVVWHQEAGNGPFIYTNKYTAGSGWGASQTIESMGGIYHSIAMQDDGKAMVVWASEQGDTLYWTSYDPAVGWSQNANVVTNANGIIGNPIVQVDQTGNYSLIWLDTLNTSSSNQQVFAASFDTALQTWSTPELIHPGTISADSSDFEMGSTGNGAAIWTETENGQTFMYSSILSVGGSTTTPIVSVEGYVIQAGDSWVKIANYLYGTQDVAGQLQSKLGDPPLTAGDSLTGLPVFLSANVTTTITIPASYTVQLNDDWSSITLAIYNDGSQAAQSALHKALGTPLPALVAGTLIEMPPVISYSPVNTTNNVQTDVTDALNYTTSYVHDSLGRLVLTLSPMVNGQRISTEYQYDADDNLVAVIDGNQRSVNYRYDTQGRLEQQQDSLGNTISYRYDNQNQRISETVYRIPDPDGAGPQLPAEAKTTRYAYDLQNRLRFTISAEGKVIERQYNSEGLLRKSITYKKDFYNISALSQTDALTEQDLILWSTETDTSATPVRDLSQIQLLDYKYDFRGQVSTVTSFATVDINGVGIRDGSERVTRYIYDQAGSLLQSVDGRGEATAANTSDYISTFTYDGLGRKLSEQRWVNATENRTLITNYDDLGNQVTTTLQSGLASISSFDANGNLTNIVQQDGQAQLLGESNYIYDNNGQLRYVDDPVGARVYTLFDEAGRLVMSVNANGAVIESMYDQSNNLVKTIQYSNVLSASTLTTLSDVATGVPVDYVAIRLEASGVDDRVARLVYDQANRLVMRIDEQGYVQQTIYDGTGRVIEEIGYATAIDLSALPAVVVPAAITLTPSLPTDVIQDRQNRYFYSDDGLQQAVLDAEGYITENIYNGANELIETIRYANQLTDPTLLVGGGLTSIKTSIGGSAKDQYSYYFYDTRGQQTAALDKDGYLTEYNYDLSGNIQKEIRYANVANTYTGVETVATLRPTVNSNDAILSRVYDGINQLTELTNLTRNTVTQFEYDQTGNLVRSTVAANTTEVRTNRAQYDVQGNVLAELSARGTEALEALLLINPNASIAEIDAIWAEYATNYTYDENGRRLTASYPTGGEIWYYYDGQDQLRYRVEKADDGRTIINQGEVTEYSYTVFGEIEQTTYYVDRIDTLNLVGGNALDLVTVIDPLKANLNNTVTNNYYDSRGQVKQVIDAEQYATDMTYSAFGEVETRSQQIKATKNEITTFAYDKRGLVTDTFEDSLGINRHSQIEYDAFGRITKTTDARGLSRLTDYSYDTVGRAITTTTDPLIESTITSYDALGRTLTVQDQQNKLTQYIYDDVEGSLTIVTPELIQTKVTRNRFGERVLITDGNQNVTEFQYDKDGNLSTEIFGQNIPAESRTYAHEFDAGGRKIKTTDANGVQTVFQYDAANRKIKRTVDPQDTITNPDGLNLVSEYSYDALGRKVESVDANGVKTITKYDRSGQISSITIDPVAADNPDGLNIRTDYEYNGLGNTVQVIKGVGTPEQSLTKYAFDNLGRRTDKILDPDGALRQVTHFVYDGNDNIVAKKTAFETSQEQVTRYVYTENNQLKYTVDALGYVSEVSYDEKGREIQTITRYNAISTTGMDDEITQTQVVDALAARLAPQPAKDQITDTIYDNDNRIDSKTYAVGTIDQYSEFFGYDGNGNVIRHTNGRNDREYFAYDSADRVTRSIDYMGYVIDTTFTSSGKKETETRYMNLVAPPINPDDRWAYNSSNPVIDTKDILATYTYDTANRLETTTVPYDGAATTTSKLVYDGMGNITRTLEALGLPEERVVDREYDAVGNMVSETTYFTESTGPGWQSSQSIEAGEGRARAPAVAKNNNGQSIAVWRQNDASGNDVLTVNFFDGKNWTGEQQRTAFSDPAAVIDVRGNPEVVMDDFGNATVVWSQYEYVGNIYTALAYAEFYDVQTGWQGAQLLGEIDLTDQSIAVDSGGVVTVTWQDTGANSGVRIKQYTHGPTGWGISTTLSTTGAYPKIASDSKGNLAVVWQETDTTTNVTRLLMKTYQSGVWQTAPAIEIAAVPTGKYTRETLVGVYYENDKIYIGWQAGDFDNPTAEHQLWVNIYDTKLARFQTAELIDSNSTTAYYNVDMTVSENGDAVIIWDADISNPSVVLSTGNLWAKIYSNEAGWQAKSLIYSTSMTSSIGNIKVAVDSLGNYQVVWNQFIGLAQEQTYSAQYYNAVDGWVDVSPILGEPGIDYTDYALSQDVYGNSTLVYVYRDSSGIRNVSSLNYSSGNSRTTGVQSGWQTPQLLETGTVLDKNPAVASSVNGQSIAVWSQRDASGNDALTVNIFNGQNWTGEQQRSAISNPAALVDVRSNPDVVMDDVGNATVVWSQNENVGTSYMKLAYAEYYDAHTGWQGAVLLGEIDVTDQSIAVDSNGVVTVTWQDTGANSGIRIKQYTPGTGWGVSRTLSSTGSYPQMAGDSKGNLAVIWQETDTTTSVTRLLMKIYQAGVWQAQPVEIAAVPTGVDTRKTLIDVYYENDMIYVGWQAGDIDKPAALHELWVNIYDTKLARLQTAELIDSNMTTAFYDVAMTVSKNGDAVFVWAADDINVDSNLSTGNLWAKHYNNVTGWQAKSLIYSSYPSDIYIPKVAADGQGNFQVVWGQTVDSLIRQQTYSAQYFNAIDGWVDANPIVAEAGINSFFELALSMDVNGNSTLVYEYSDSSGIQNISALNYRSGNSSAANKNSTSYSSTSRFGYDIYGNQTKIIDPRAIELTESDSPRAIQARLELGYSVSIPWGAARGKRIFELTKVEIDTLRNSYTTVQEFDALQRKTKVTMADGSTTETKYDNNGNIINVIDANLNNGYFFYDALNRSNLQIDPSGYVSETIYDVSGNESETIRYFNRIEGAYDENSTISIVDTLPITIPAGIAYVVRSVNDQNTSASYDALNRVSLITDAENYSESFKYDAMGNQTYLLDKNGNEFTYVYNANGNLITEKLPITVSSNIEAGDFRSVNNSSGSTNLLGAKSDISDNGDIFYVWTEKEKNSTGGSNVYARYYTAGQGMGEVMMPTQIPLPNGNSGVLDVKFYSDGKALVRFFTPGTIQNGVFLRGGSYIMMFSRGVGWTDIGQLDSADKIAYGTSKYFKMSANKNGDFAATWIDQSNGTSKVKVQLFLNGVLQPSETIEIKGIYNTSVEPTGINTLPEAVVDDFGSVTVIWEREYEPVEGNFTKLAVKRYEAGIGWQPGFFANGTETNSSRIIGPNIAVDSMGNVSIAWNQQSFNEVLVDDTYLLRYANGAWQTTVFPEKLGDATIKMKVSDNGVIHFVWFETVLSFDPSQSRIRYAVFTPGQGFSQIQTLMSSYQKYGFTDYVIDNNGEVELLLSSNSLGVESLAKNYNDPLRGRVTEYLYSTENADTTNSSLSSNAFKRDGNGNYIFSWGETIFNQTSIKYAIVKPVVQSYAVMNKYRYNALGQRIEKTEAVGLEEQRITRYDYSKNGKLSREYFQLANAQIDQKLYNYDARGNMIRQKEKSLAATYYIYDANNNRVGVIDAEGYIHTQQFDAGGNLISSRTYSDALPAGIDMLTVPDLTIIPQVTEGRYRETRFQYDSLNREIESKTKSVLSFNRVDNVSQSSVIYSTQYNAFGSKIVEVDPNGNQAYFYYDKLQNLVLQIDAEGYVTRQIFDGNGNVIESTQYGQALSDITLASLNENVDVDMLVAEVAGVGDDRTKILTYNKLNKLKEDRLVDSTVYFARSVLLSIGGPAPVGIKLDLVTRFNYDGLGNVTGVSRSDGSQVNYKYDALSRITLQQGEEFTDFTDNKVRNQTSFVYNGLGDLSSESNLGGLVVENASVSYAYQDNTTRYLYDEFGQLKRKIDPEGNVTDFNYNVTTGLLDEMHEWKSNTELSSTPLPKYVATRYEYDNLNRQVALTAGNETNYVTYNAYNELLSKGLKASNSSHLAKAQIYFEYDDAGRLIRSNQEGGVDTAFYYDQAGNNTARIQSGLVDIDIKNADYLALLNSDPLAYKRTESDYDKLGRNTNVYQAPINIISDATTSIDQVWVDVISDPSVGGSINFTNVSATNYTMRFSGQPESGTNLKLWLWGSNVTKPVAATANLGVRGPGEFQFNSTSNPTGLYQYEFQIRNNFGEIINVLRGEVNLGTNPQVIRQEQLQLQSVITSGQTIVTNLQRSQAYNAYGEIVEETDGRGIVTTLVYNNRGQLIQKVEPGVGNLKENGINVLETPITNYYYDIRGNLIGKRDPNGNTNLTQFDSAGNVTKEIHADFGIVDYGYDLFQNKRSYTPYGNLDAQIKYKYDKNNNLINTIRPIDSSFMVNTADGLRVPRQEHYTYNQLGERASRTDFDTNKSTTIYDDLGRVVETNSYGVVISQVTFRKYYSADSGRKVSYEYLIDDTTGNKITITYYGGRDEYKQQIKNPIPNPDPSQIVKRVIDEYDYFGRLVKHTDMSDRVTEYTYNKAGWLIHQQSTAGQDIDYSYYRNGLQKEVIDNSLNKRSLYRYDENGNRTFEGYTQANGKGNQEVYQWSTIEYDVLNRVSKITDPKYSITYQYDLNGNRRKMTGTYQKEFNNNLTKITAANNTYDIVRDSAIDKQTYWYTYDSMNRFLITKGTFVGNPGTGSIQRGSDGYKITYRKDSQRATQEYRDNDGNINIEKYSYNVAGLLTTTKQTRYREKPGLIVILYGNALISERVSYNYAGDVELFNQYKLNANGDDTVLDYSEDYSYFGDGLLARATSSDGSTKNYQYDILGNIDKLITEYTGYSTTLSYRYDYWDNAKKIESKMSGVINDPRPKWTPGQAYFEYDVNGHLTRVTDAGADGQLYSAGSSLPNDDRILNYKLDAKGKILRRDEMFGGASTQGSAKNNFRNYFYLNGNGTGDAGNSGVFQNADYATSLAARAETSDSAGPIFSFDFDYNFIPINNSYPAITNGYYTVNKGDTLQSVALAVWGDSSLWYLLADANSLDETTPLRENQTLIVPNVVTNIHNNSGTVKVYNPGELLGNTDPTLPEAPPPPPPPPKDKCAVVKIILVVVVAAVVTYFSAGTLSTAIGAWATSTIGAIAVGAASAAAGSIASQLVSKELGLTDSFSWRQVGIAALSGGITAGITSSFAISSFGKIGNSIANATTNALISNTVSQQINRRFGDQEKFDWRSLAVSAISAPINASISGFADSTGYTSTNSLNGASLSGFGADLATGFTTGLVTESLNKLVLKDYKFSWANVAGSAFSKATVGAISAEREQNSRIASFANVLRQKQAEQRRELIDAYDTDDDGFFKPLENENDLNAEALQEERQRALAEEQALDREFDLAIQDEAGLERDYPDNFESDTILANRDPAKSRFSDLLERNRRLLDESPARQRAIELANDVYYLENKLGGFNKKNNNSNESSIFRRGTLDIKATSLGIGEIGGQFSLDDNGLSSDIIFGARKSLGNGKSIAQNTKPETKLDLGVATIAVNYGDEDLGLPGSVIVGAKRKFGAVEAIGEGRIFSNGDIGVALGGAFEPVEDIKVEVKVRVDFATELPLGDYAYSTGRYLDTAVNALIGTIVNDTNDIDARNNTATGVIRR